MQYRCALCGQPKAAGDLQTISGIFDYDAEEVSALVGETVEGQHGSDTLTVCKGVCADTLRENNTVIVTDIPFTEYLQREDPTK